MNGFTENIKTKNIRTKIACGIRSCSKGYTARGITAFDAIGLLWRKNRPRHQLLLMTGAVMAALGP